MNNMKTDLMVQFAMLWGMKRVPVIQADQKYADAMEGYDSEEIRDIVTEWADEYLESDCEDTCDFFEEHIDVLLGFKVPCWKCEFVATKDTCNGQKPCCNNGDSPKYEEIVCKGGTCSECGKDNHG